ncbi:hypothetical protein F443_01489 [Phytophthora nicotianae P1569]|uniref:Uncharacterized protein n=1 Tax=Phytophthora nicotianae P1569 TaxID=1317065 RepID=V9FYR1_PHYNI|nr:hypothetical protein F443_01489 [Phytophthora nicotianae P1569]
MDLLYLLKTRLYGADLSIRASAINLYLARTDTGKWLSMDDMDVEPADDAQIQSWLQVKLDPEQMIGDSITRTWKIQQDVKDAGEVDALVDLTHEVQRLEQDITPFIVLESSVGMGRTQMAFNLMARDDVDVFYIICGRKKDDVLNGFRNISHAFMRCVKKDLPCVGDGSVSEISQQNELYTYSFLYAVLGGVPALTGTRTRDEVFQTKRDVTNGVASDLLGLKESSEYEELSCIIFPMIPRFKPSDSMALSRLPAIVGRSRPLFAKQALDYTSANKFDDNTKLDEYMNAMMKTLSAKWDEDRVGAYFHVGQVRLFIGSSYRPRPDPVGHVRCHSSRPAPTTPTRLSFNWSGKLVDDQKDPWTCSRVVPSLDDDPLLHFIFMGGSGFHALPTLEDRQFHIATLLSGLNGDNSPERLQELVAGAIVAASRHNGFAGRKDAKFGIFLSALMYEFGSKAERHTRQRFSEVLEKTLSQIHLSVPNCLPLDMELPQFLKNSQLKFGTLKRVQTDYSGLVFVDVKISVELASNQPEEEIDFVNTIRRTPRDSIVHIIILGLLEQSYFDDVDALAEEDAASRVIIFIGSTQEIKIIHARGDGDTGCGVSATKLIIFLELPDFSQLYVAT